METFGVDEYANPFPHFTLYPLPDDADITALMTAIEEATKDQSPFSVHTTGIGVFPQNPVWLPIAKSPELSAFQSDIVEAVEELGPPPVPYYNPHRWFPHVGFAIADSNEQTGDIVEFLLDYDLDWEFTVDNITITRPPAENEKYEKLASIEL